MSGRASDLKDSRAESPTVPQAPPPLKHTFTTLDGLRGLAALAVAVFHMPRIFGGIRVPNAHLAVDFFLQLSGFVIAYAYAERIDRGLALVKFLRTRINRLYPVFGVGIGLGFLVGLVALKSPTSGLIIQWTLPSLIGATLLNLLMLPAVGAIAENSLFPTNPPMWTIFDEVVINVLYCAFRRCLSSGWTTLGLSGILFLAVIPYGLKIHGLDVGFGWNGYEFGLLRLSASFLVGVTIFNFKLFGTRTSQLAALAGFVALGGVLFNQATGLIFELATVVLVFPAVIILGAKWNPSSGFFASLCAQLGKTSYAFYAIHKPVYQLLAGLLFKLAPNVVSRGGFFVGVVLLSFIGFVSWCLATYYEPKARQAFGRIHLPLRRNFNRSQGEGRSGDSGQPST